eukprot:jgi/Chlat1/6328/Chrsp44S05896
MVAAAPKVQKYDRQLRIWGEHGQARLESAKVCLLNAGPTGSEALKNLVLGGIASFTVVDEAKVEAADFGNNFFVSLDNLGDFRAKCVSSLLQELNESVAGRFVEASPESLIDSNPAFFEEFTLVIATQLCEKVLLKLDRLCRTVGIPLLIARSYGLTGLVRISTKEHCVIEAKPDNAVDDLRLHAPWPELLQHVNSIDLNVLDTHHYYHVPYAVLLLKAVQQWKAEHDGDLPATSKQRNAFKESIKAMERTPDQENLKEALTNAFKAWAPPRIGSDLKKVFDLCPDSGPDTSDFWIMMAALKAFVQEEGQGEMPLDGSIPDMHSMTDYYLALQKIYQAKAASDMAAIAQRVKALLSRAGRAPSSITQSQIKLFCKNARYLSVLRYRTLEEEYHSNTCRSAELQNMLQAENTASNASIYVLLRAVDRFQEQNNRFPGIFDAYVNKHYASSHIAECITDFSTVREVEDDVRKLKAVANTLLSECGVSGPAAVSEDVTAEICRFGASELHPVAAIIGGIAAQEAIKVITGQFVPLGDTLVLNAMSGTSSVLPL